MKRKLLTSLYIVLFIVFIFLFQMFVIDPRNLFGVKPNLILISVIVVSLWYGLYKGAVYSFIIGLVTDMIFGSSYGIFTVSYVITGILVGFLNDNYRKENKIALVYVTIIATCVFELSQYFIYLLNTGIYSSFFYLIFQIILSTLLNIIIVYLVYSLIYKIIQFFDDSFDRRYRFLKSR